MGGITVRGMVMAHAAAKSFPEYLRRMSKKAQYAGQAELTILARELQLNLRVYEAVWTQGAGNEEGRRIKWSSAVTYSACVAGADTIELQYTGDHFDLIWRGLNPSAGEPQRK